MHNERANVWECPDCGTTYPYVSMAEARRYNKSHECQGPTKLDQRIQRRKQESDEFSKAFDAAGEEIIENEDTGGKKGRKLARFDLLPAGPLFELAKHYGRGSRKYEDRNWEKGYDWSLSFGAMMRHAWAFWNGEDIDPETGSPHLAAVAWHAFTLMQFSEQHPELDDRPSTQSRDLNELVQEKAEKLRLSR